jgi:hypothetical protein
LFYDRYDDLMRGLVRNVKEVHKREFFENKV